VAKHIIAAWKSGAIKYDIPTNSTQHEAKLLQLAIDKAIGQLGWRPAYTVEQCLDETVAWYRSDHQAVDVPALSRAQIREYTAAASLVYGIGRD
jgi:CDP-glucose 4,6-dehydratase